MPIPPALTAPDGSPASAFSFGTMQFGGTADATTARALYDACRDAGISFFDTAHIYNEGRAETLLGQFAAPERDKLVIATKTGMEQGGCGGTTIAREFDESRTRLGMDYIDILYLHRWDGATPLEESFAALATLKDAGKIGHIGLSNFAAWQVMKAVRVAAGFGLSVSILQPMYNLVKRQAEVELLPMAASEGFNVAPYSPLGGGLLTGKYAAGGAGRLAEDDRYKARYGQGWMHDAAAALAALGAELGIAPATLAVAWVAHNPAVTGPILSARNVEQLVPSLAAMRFDMDAALYARVSALTPTPPPATDRLEETL
ncbi:aldo/keto reductase [Actibacterium sp. D379-3]